MTSNIKTCTIALLCGHYYLTIFSEIIHESHGTADNFIQCSEGTKALNIESLVTEISAGSLETYQ